MINYSIVFINFYSYGKMNLIQTTTGTNANTLYHINQIQLFWISNVNAHSLTIRSNLQEFHLGLSFTELDNITIIKNFIILHSH